MRSPKIYFVYLMSSRSKTLYVGVTNSLIRRVREHKLRIGSTFASRYKLDRLMYYERFEDVHRAIGREKEIKGLVANQKDCSDCVSKSGLERLELGVVSAASVSTGRCGANGFSGEAARVILSPVFAAHCVLVQVA